MIVCFQTRSVQTFQQIVLIVLRNNLVCHHRGCISIYRLLSYPFIFWNSIWFAIKRANIYNFFFTPNPFQVLAEKMIGWFILQSFEAHLLAIKTTQWLNIRIYMLFSLRYKTMANKLMYIPNDVRYPVCRLKLMVERFEHSTWWSDQYWFLKSPRE